MMELVLYGLAPCALLSLAWLLWEARLLVRILGKRELALFAGCVALAAAQLSREPGGLRVLSDEASHLTTARAILSSGEANRDPEWKLDAGSLEPLHRTPAFRPVLFSVLEAAAGLFTRLDVRTGIWINALLYTLLLFGAALLALARWGWRCAPCAALVLATNPVLSACAAAGGYDVLALLLFLLSLSAWLAYAESGNGFRLALAAGGAFASTRYEGLFWVGLLLAGHWARERRPPEIRLFVAVALLTAPLLAQRALFPSHIDVPAGTALFSVARIPEHAYGLVWLLFAGPTSRLAGVGLLALLTRVYRPPRGVALPLVFLGGFLVYLLGFHAGNPTLPNQSRLYLPYLALLLLAAASVPARFRTARDGWLASGVLLLLAGAVVPDPALWNEPATLEFAGLRTQVEKSEPGTLFVYPFPAHVVALGRAAIQPWRFLREPDATGTEPVVWVEEIPFRGGGSGAAEPGRPPWVSRDHLEADVPVGRMRSLQFYRRFPGH